MALNRYLYAAALGLCFLSYLGWGQWLSWVLLQALLIFPWISLGLSLPAIARFRAEPACPRQLLRGSWGVLSLLGICHFPVPPFRGRLRVEHLPTGEQRLYRPDTGIPTRHCGGYRVTVEKGRVCDYLGLFSFPFRCPSSGFYLVLPRPIPVNPVPDYLKRPIEPGDAELRPYRPGDPLRRIHRKLSLKTDTLILLNPLCRHPPVVISLELTGDADALDRILGEFIWLGRELTKKNIPFSVEANTAGQRISMSVESPQQLEHAFTRLLCMPIGGIHG